MHRILLLSLVGLVAGCVSPEPASAPPAAPADDPAPAAPPPAPEPASTPPPPGESSPVAVTFGAEGMPALGSVSIAGVPKAQLAGDWIEARARPSFWWSRGDVSTAAPLEVDLPLPAGLHYFAVLSVDGDDLPDPGDFIGGPSVHRLAGQPLALTVDRGFGQAVTKTPTGDWSLTLTSDVDLGLMKVGRILVAGWEPGKDALPGPESSAPSFLWSSEKLPLEWPLKLSSSMPDGLDVLVALDLDDSGEIDAGDLSTKVLPTWSASEAAEVLSLTEVVPPRPGGVAR